MATIREIADRAGVSLGTVDRVLHNRGRVSAETAEKIRGVIAELGFTPNLFARNLATSRAYRFGVLMPLLDQDGGYWQLPLKGMQRAAEAHRAYRISLEVQHFDRYDPVSFKAAHQRLLAAGVDGILMAPVIQQAAKQLLDQAENPVHVMFDVDLDHPGVLCHIGQDSMRAGQLAGRLMGLLCPGGGTIAVLQPDTDNAHIANRVSGFRASLDESSYRLAIKVRAQAGDLASFQVALGDLIRDLPDLAGIMVVDSTTHLVARALADSPRKGLPLIGYDLMEEDIPWLENGAIPFLITQDPVGQGEAGINALFSHVVINHAVEARITVPLNIVTWENYSYFLTR